MNAEDLWKFQKIKALVLGDFMLDKYIMGDVKRISPEAPVPVVSIRNKEVHLGGAGNVINNIVSLGAAARILACVGTDPDGDYIMKRMHAKGVDIRFARQTDSEQTTVKTRVVSKGQQFLRYDEETIKEVNGDYLEYLKDNIEAVFEGIKVVIISDYGKGMVTERSAQLLIGEAQKRRIPVIVDPKGSDYSKYAGATVCTPNMSEFLQVTGCGEGLGEEEIAAQAEKLCAGFRLGYVLITRSEQGMSLVRGSDGKKKDYPAVAKEVIDVTGAGDTVISVFSLGLAAGLALDDCCELSNDAASIVISQFGAATATLEELLHGREQGPGANKVVNAPEIGTIAARLHEQNKTIVFTNGCFDLLHAGHISSFEQAKALGDTLIVGLNSDLSVKRIKGERRPIINQDDRAKLLGALEIIDYVVIFDEDTPEKLIRIIQPDVLVKGSDWDGKAVAGQDFVEAHGGSVQFIDLKKGLSTTGIINRINELYQKP